MASRKPVSKPVTALPPDITVADTKAPPMGEGMSYTERKEFMGDLPYYFTFYQTQGFGWVLCTLGIGGKGRGDAARTYGITVADGKVVRVGRGPHVLKIVEVYVSKKNKDRMARYVELLRKGLAEAGTIRDRISTRRAQGQINRANGMTFWHW